MKIVSKGVDSLESGLINKSNLRGAMFKKDPISIESENKDPIIAEKVAISAIERANEAVLIANRKFEYSIHEKTKQIMVKIIDIETNEIVREIPPEKILDLVATLWEMSGLIIDERR
jgi:flagellar protein FlaG